MKLYEKSFREDLATLNVTVIPQVQNMRATNEQMTESF